MKPIILGLLVTLSVAACNLIGIAPTGCDLPEDFTETDLLGTWEASYKTTPKARDVLILRDDGYYKQTIHLEIPTFEYEGNWLPWRVEYSDTGIPYLFLEGYRLYAYRPNFIDDEIVGGSDGYWFDFCQRAEIQMPPGEGVLIVGGVPARWTQPPRGIEISFPGRSIENSPWIYTIQE
jgi:hypothetical protein